MKMKSIKYKKTILVSVIVLVMVSLSGLFIKNRIQSQVKELFRMNKILQQEGYYMAEFEFKMLGILYELDKGQYIKALSTLSHYHEQLTNRKNLIKLPVSGNMEEEMNFYLGLQNPATGAFMDDTFPYCTYNEPTENTILHLEYLAIERDIPLKLKYPLTYLDSINTKEKLYAFLDDVAYVGWLGSRFPETSFVFARSLLSFWNDEGVITQNNLYHFSDEFKQALLTWFYIHQDSVSGYWGPMSVEDGQLITIDLNNTASIIKTFIDKNGNNIHKEFPLRFKDKIFATTLGLLQKALPDENEDAKWHAWNVSMRKGIKMLLRYLWKDASDENRQKMKMVLENYIRIQFEKFYIPQEGAFSYYPHAQHASLDGSGGFIYKDIGAYSAEKQKRLWGDPDSLIKTLGHIRASVLTEKDLDILINNPGINSLRVYNQSPDYDSLYASVIALFYPKETPVLDAVELVPAITAWLDSTNLSIGNWTSREKIRDEYARLNITKPLIFKRAVPLDELNRQLNERKEIDIIAFDVLQIARYRITYVYSPLK